jgi:hypothetical protein
MQAAAAGVESVALLSVVAVPRHIDGSAFAMTDDFVPTLVSEH